MIKWEVRRRIEGNGYFTNPVQNKVLCCLWGFSLDVLNSFPLLWLKWLFSLHEFSFGVHWCSNFAIRCCYLSFVLFSFDAIQYSLSLKKKCTTYLLSYYQFYHNSKLTGKKHQAKVTNGWSWVRKLVENHL